MFPPKAEKKEPGRFGFGTTEAVDSLVRRLNSTANMSMMVAINIATLIRNAVDTKESKAQNVVNNVRSQMNSIANELADICHNKWRSHQHHILFYLTSPEKIVPQAYKRVNTGPTSTIIESATRLFIHDVKPGDQDDGNVHAHVRIADQLRLPSFKGIIEAIDKFTQHDVDLQLISHMPMDYHVAFSSGRNCFLYRSHTGEIVRMTPEYLGQTVFKNSDIPFYPVTHVLLGDKYLIKGTLTPKEKKMLAEYAAKYHLSMHTAQYVRSKIKEYRFVLPYDFT